LREERVLIKVKESTREKAKELALLLDTSVVALIEKLVDEKLKEIKGA